MDVRIFTHFLLLFICFSVLSAQEQSGFLEGRVLDSLGYPIENANVTLSSNSLQGTKGTVTNKYGDFYTYKVPAGIYEVRISHIGKQTIIFQNVVIQLGKKTALGNVILPPVSKELSEIIISSSKPIIDPSSTSHALNLEEKVYQYLPVQRNYKSLMSLSPLATESFYGDGINLSGSTGWENTYYIDGINVTDPMRGISGTNLPYNFIKEIEIISGGYEAQYGKSIGGVANVITHQGGNKFHGQVFGFFTDQSFAGDYKIGTAKKRIKDFATYDFGISMGGPIVSDELWYFAAYSPNFKDQNVDIPGVGIYKDKTRSHIFAGKLTWQVNPSTNFVLTVLGDPTTQERVENQLGVSIPTIRKASNPEPYLGDVTTGGYNLSLRANHIINNNFYVDAMISYSDTKFKDVASSQYGLTEPFYMDFTDLANFTVSGGYGRQRENHIKRYSAKINGTYFLGSHILKLGIEYEDNYVDDLTINKAGLDGELPNPIMLQSGPLYIGWWAEKNVTVNNRIPSFYIQDSWSLTQRLRLNGGIRWDGQFLVGSDGKVAQKILTQWQPRVGFAYNFGENNNQKVYASFGRYYEQLPLIMTSAYFSNDISLQNFYQLDPRSGSTPYGVNNISSSIQPEDDDLIGQHFDEFTIGYERIIYDQYILGIKGIYRNLREVVEDADKFIGNFDGQDIYQRILGNPGRGQLNFLPKFTREYSALQITFQKPRGIFNFLISYVLSRNYGNYPGLFDSDMIYPDANLGNLNRSIQLVNATGLLPNDRTHIVKLFGSYNFDFGLTTGTSFILSSGTPLNEYGPLPPNDGSNIIFHSKRGTAGRTSTIWDWNIRFSYNIDSFSNWYNGLKIIVDIFHLFSQREVVIQGQHKYIADDGQGNLQINESYLNPEVYQNPTTIRLGVELRF